MRCPQIVKINGSPVQCGGVIKEIVHTVGRATVCQEVCTVCGQSPVLHPIEFSILNTKKRSKCQP